MKLLVVDDDTQIREGIVEGINWSEIGISDVKSSSNGIEALEIFQMDFPEIVVTDIRMPGMDGLELFKKIKELKPSTKVIIISGYSDFDYLKKAIQYGAIDYELKPVRVKNLIALINRVKEDIIKEKTTGENFVRYQKTYIANFMESLLLGKLTDRNIILEEMEQYFGFDAKGFLLLNLLEPDCVQNETAGKKTGCHDALEHYFNTKPMGCSGLLFWKIDEKRTLLIIRTVDSMLYQQYLYNELRNIFRQINQDFETEHGITLSVGISNVGTVSELAALYRQASEALEYKFYTGNKSINLYQKINVSAAPYEMAAAAMGKLSRAISDFDLNMALELIGNEFDHIKCCQAQSKKSVYDFSLGLMKFLNSTLKSKGYESIEQYDEKIGDHAGGSCQETVEDFRRLVIGYYQRVLADLNDEKKVFQNKSILKAVEYIKKNYREDLTVEVIAQYIGKSPNYFCHVFKKEMQMSFTEYLNRIRIRKAKELILSTNKLVYEVCREVGYQDYAYFVQLFKKFENCTPTELKQNL